MAQVATTIRLDNELKRQFEALCDEFGMNLNTAINIFVKAVVREKAIPFKIEAEEQSSAARMEEVIKRLRGQAKENGTLGMTIEEINAEIAAYRNGE